MSTGAAAGPPAPMPAVAVATNPARFATEVRHAPGAVGPTVAIAAAPAVLAPHYGTPAPPVAPNSYEPPRHDPEIGSCAVCHSEDVGYVLQMLVPGMDQAIKAGFCSEDCLAKKLGFARSRESGATAGDGVQTGAGVA